MEKLKFLQLYKSIFAQNFSFKEKFLVFEAPGEKDPKTEKTETVDPAAAAERKLVEGRKTVEDGARKAESELATKEAAGLTFKIEDQASFDNFMDDIDEDGVQAVVNNKSENIYALITFAQGNTKNMAKILEAVNDEEIHVDKLSEKALDELIAFAVTIGEEEELAETVIDAAEENKARDEQLIQLMDFYKGKSGEKYEEAMSAIFRAVMECENVKSNHELHTRLLSHYLEKNDKEKLSAYLDKFKYWNMTVSLMLIASKGKSQETWFVKEIFEQIKGNAKLLGELQTKDIVALIKNVGINNILPKLSTKQKVKLLVEGEITTEEKNGILTKTPLNDIDSGSKIKIVNNTELDLEARKLIYEHALSDKEKTKVSPKVAESFGIKVKEEEAPKVAEAREEEKTFDQIELSKVLDGTGINPDARKGKSFGWTLKLPKGKESGRSFTKTEAFKTAFAAAYNKGELNTPEKAKLFCYKWLLEEIYVKPKIKRDKYGVKHFEKSQETLKNEITALEATIKTGDKEGEAPKLEKGGKGPAAVEATDKPAADKPVDAAAPQPAGPEAKPRQKGPEPKAPATEGVVAEAGAPRPVVAAEPDRARQGSEPKAPAPEVAPTSAPVRRERAAGDTRLEGRAAPEAVPVKPKTELETIKDSYFKDFDKVEETTRTITPDTYRLKSNTTIYRDGKKQSIYISSDRDYEYPEIKDQRIFKVTNKDGTSLYVAKSEKFFGMAKGEFKLAESRNPETKQPAYINIEDLVKVPNKESLNQYSEEKADVKSEWDLETAPIEDPDLIKGKSYKTVQNARYHTSNYKYEPVPAGTEVTVLNAETRRVEGKKYVKVKIKIEGKDKEVWIAKRDLLIPEEDTIFISTNYKFNKPKQIPEAFKTVGKFEITNTEEIRGSELLDKIFAENKDLKSQFDASGLSRAEYLSTLLEYRKENTITLIVPEKQLSAIIAGYEAKAFNKDYQAKDTAEQKRIFETRETYFQKLFSLKNPEIIKAINNDELWNDLWERRGPYEKMFINGQEKIVHLMKEIGIPEDQIRTQLRAALQDWTNEEIDFEEIFERFFEDKRYYYEKDEDGDTSGDFDDFQKEIGELEESLKPWQTAEGKAKIEKINKYNQLVPRVKAAMTKAKEQGKDFRETDEWKAYEAEGAATKTIRDEYYKRNDKEETVWKSQSIPERFNRLNYLKTKILFPVSELLDAFESISVNVSTAQNFHDQNDALLSQLPTTREEITDIPFYNLESLVKENPDPKRLPNAPENMDIVAASKNVQDKFAKLLTDLGVDPKNFDPRDVLRLTFQLYSVDTLSKEGCLQKSKDSKNKFLLIDLPENFNKDNAQVKELFGKIKSKTDINPNKELIRKISEAIDNNKAAVKRLLEVFSKDEGPLTYDLIPIDILGITYLVRALDGEDRRELTATMADFADRKDVRMPDDYLKRYTSDKSAFVEILSRITHTKDGVDFYDQAQLKTELEKRVKAGLMLIVVDQKHFPQIHAQLSKEYGDLSKAENISKAIDGIVAKLSNLNTPLDATTKEIIRVGHIIEGVMEKSEKTTEYSKNPKIRAIQEQLKKNGYSNEDLKKVDEALGGAIIVPVYGSGYGADFSGAPLNFGDKWTLGFGGSVTQDGVSGGAALAKGFELSKDGRTVLTLSVQGGYLSIGGGAQIKFPISETVDMNAGAVAGVTACGFYALGFVGARRNLNAEQLKAFRESLGKEGLNEVDKLFKAKASPTKIREALMKTPYGPQFQKAKDLGVDDKGLVELYSKLRENIDKSTTEEEKLVPFEVIGGEAFGGLVNGVPVVGAYLEFAIADRIMVVRTRVPGDNKIDETSDAQIESLLTRQLGKEVTVLKEKASDSGHFIFDSATGKIAVLESKQQLDLKAFDSIGGFNEKLATANMGITKEGSDFRLHIYEPKAEGAKGNIKIVVDPMLKEQDIYFTVEGNKILFKGLSEAELREFIVTREDFHYPANKESVQKFSVITIKNNPKRSRVQIEKESPNIIYQAAGLRPGIRAGIGVGKEVSNILTPGAYKAKEIKPEDTIESRSIEDFEAWKTERDAAVNVIERSTFEQEPRKGLIPELIKKWYNANQLLYRQLSTDGQETFDLPRLNGLLKTAAEKKFPNLTNRELNDMHLWLLNESFMNAKDKKEIFLHNLKTCTKHVIKPAFKKAGEKLGLKSTGEQMGEYVAKYLRDNVDVKSKNFETFAEGSLFLSAAGTMDVIGLRGTTYYGDNVLGLMKGIIGFKEFDPSKKDIEGDIGKALLETLSPLERDPAKNKEFMESPLALKLISQDGIYLILGPENARKVTACFRDKKVDTANQAAFDKFRDIVIQVRDAQIAGKNFVELQSGHEIRMNTRVGMGAYKKCTNPTMVGTEEISIYAPVAEGNVAYNREKVLMNAESVRKAISLIVGVRVSLPDSPPPDEPEEETPAAEPEPEGEVSVEVPGADEAPPPVEGNPKAGYDAPAE